MNLNVGSMMAEIFSDRNDLNHNPYREFNMFINKIMLPEAVNSFFAKSLNHELSYYVNCYVRDIIAGTLVYWLTAGIWHIAFYHAVHKSILLGNLFVHILLWVLWNTSSLQIWITATTTTTTTSCHMYSGDISISRGGGRWTFTLVTHWKISYNA